MVFFDRTQFWERHKAQSQPRQSFDKKTMSWLHVFLHFFTPFRWPQNSLECVFIFYCSEWKSSAKLSSHSWAGLYPRLLQAVSETRQCECSEAIMSVVQFVDSTQQHPEFGHCTWFNYFVTSITHYETRYSPWYSFPNDITTWERHQVVAETNVTNWVRCTFQDPKRKRCPPAAQRNRKKKLL